MTTILDILGTSTPVSDLLAEKLGYVKAAIACRVFFYQNLKNGVCSASVETLSKKLGMSQGTISTNLKWLRDNDYIIVIGNYRKGNTTNHYKVTKKFYDAIEQHSSNECNVQQMNVDVQQMNGKEDIKEDIKNTTTSSNVFKTYESEIGFLSPVIAQQIKSAIDDYSEQLVIDAINQASVQNKRKWSYINGILIKWKSDGKGKRNGNGSTVLRTTKNPDGSYNI